MKFELNDSYKKDSILIENIVEFYKYSDENTEPIDAVRFKIKITNLGNLPIPNFENVSGRSQFLQLFYDNKNSYNMNITNGFGSIKIQYIKKGESDVFYTDWILSGDSDKFKKPIKIMWNYLGIDSQTLLVDIENRKILKYY